MPGEKPILKLTNTTLKSLNLQLIRVTYSKRAIIPSVWLPPSFLPLVYPAHEFGILRLNRYFLVRPEEIPEIESRVDSLDKEVPFPPHSVLKVEK